MDRLEWQHETQRILQHNMVRVIVPSVRHEARELTQASCPEGPRCRN